MYVRTASGECYTASPNVAIEQFLSADGYRINFPLPGWEMIVRRDPDTPTEHSEFLDETIIHDCSITLRRVK
jgi:hypothetical protein